jgi:hypothetical protein
MMSNQELQDTLQICIKLAQDECYAQEVKDFQVKGEVSKTSKL